MADEMKIGDRVYVEGRKHPTKAGWFQANGEIIDILMDEDGEEMEDIVVKFDEDDISFFSADDFEWTDSLGGYWYTTQ